MFSGRTDGMPLFRSAAAMLACRRPTSEKGPSRSGPFFWPPVNLNPRRLCCRTNSNEERLQLPAAATCPQAISLAWIITGPCLIRQDIQPPWFSAVTEVTRTASAVLHPISF